MHAYKKSKKVYCSKLKDCDHCVNLPNLTSFHF